MANTKRIFANHSYSTWTRREERSGLISYLFIVFVMLPLVRKESAYETMKRSDETSQPASKRFTLTSIFSCCVLPNLPKLRSTKHSNYRPRSAVVYTVAAERPCMPFLLPRQAKGLVTVYTLLASSVNWSEETPCNKTYGERRYPDLEEKRTSFLLLQRHRMQSQIMIVLISVTRSDHGI